MRQCLAVIFLIIFTFQVFPMKGMGRLLSKSQATEDVQGDAADDDDASGVAALYGCDMLLPRCSFTPAVAICHFENKVSILIRETEALPSVFINSIPAPPPDRS